MTTESYSFTDDEVLQAAFTARDEANGNYILISDILNNLGICRHQRRVYDKRQEILPSQRVNAIIRAAGFISTNGRGRRAHYVYAGDLE